MNVLLNLIVFVGMAVLMEGVAWFTHKIMFHKRIPGLRIKPRGSYMQRIVRAHTAHHQHSDRRHGVSFGFLYAPAETRSIERAGMR